MCISKSQMVDRSLSYLNLLLSAVWEGFRRCNKRRVHQAALPNQDVLPLQGEEEEEHHCLEPTEEQREESHEVEVDEWILSTETPKQIVEL